MMRRKSQLTTTNSSNGFSLIEMAVILAIASLLMVTALGLIKTWRDQANLAENQRRIDAIQVALINFETQKSRLPCPASFIAKTTDAHFSREFSPCGASAGQVFSVKGRTGATDAYGGTSVPAAPILIGALPVRDLGLPDLYRADPYGHMYTYAVTQSEVTTLNGFAGAINVVDAANLTLLPKASDGSSGTATYVVVAHGKDGKGAYIPNSTATTTGTAPAITCTATSPGAPGLDLLNCSFEAGASPAAVGANFAFRSVPYSTKTGATTWFDDTVIYNSTFSSNVRSCTTVSYGGPTINPSALSAPPGSSTGPTIGGIDVGSGVGATGFVGAFTFTDELVYKGNLPTVIAATTAVATCPGTKKYTFVEGGCSQTYGVPVLNANGQITNTFGGDLNPGFPLPGSLYSDNGQIVLPPSSHPINPIKGTQGWECNGSTSTGIYVEAYAICCTGGEE